MVQTLRLYYLFRGLSSAFLFKVFLVFFYLERGLAFTQIGILQAVFAATVIIFEIPTGIYSDRYGRRSAMAWGALLMSLASLGYYFAWSFAVFVSLEFLLALGLTLTSGADSAFLYDMLKKSGKVEKYPEMEGKASMAKHFGMAISSAVGGLIATKSLALLFPLTSIIIFLSFLVSLLLDRKKFLRGLNSRTRETPLQFSRDSKIFRGHGSIWWVISYSSLIFLLIRVTDTLLHPVLKANGYSYMVIGFIASGGAIFAALSAFYFSRFLSTNRSILVVWIIPAILILSMIVFVYGNGVILAFILLANLGIQGIYSPLTKSVLNEQISRSEVRATVLSLESSVKRLIIALVMPLAGYIIDQSSISGGLLFISSIAGLLLFVLMFSNPVGMKSKNVAETRLDQ
ncbi:MAG: MFS transporter [Deltaproteobacteria bacterium]|nr:MFS transporter [Deltaproteobacteria bacterium]